MAIFDDDQRRDRPANPHLPYGWRRDTPISLSLLLHYRKTWVSSLRELDPSRSPQNVCRIYVSSVLSFVWTKCVQTRRFRLPGSGMRTPVAASSRIIQRRIAASYLMCTTLPVQDDS